MIYHIARRSEWSAAVRRGAYHGPTLASEGFIHCSTADQVGPTARRYFQGAADLVLLAIDESRLAAPLRWEAPARPGERKGASPKPEPLTEERFPHLYGPLPVDAVTTATPFDPNRGEA